MTQADRAPGALWRPFIVTAYDDVLTILREDVSTRAPIPRQIAGVLARTDQPHAFLLQLIEASPILANDEDHALKRRRSLQIIAGLARAWPEERLRDLYARQRAQVQNGQIFDLEKDLCRPFVATVIADTLGLALADLEQILPGVSSILDASQRETMRLGDYVRLAAETERLRPMIDKMKIEPVDGMTRLETNLLAAQTLIPTLVFPSTALTFAQCHLATSPALRHALRARPEGLSAFITEALRLAGVVARTMPSQAARTFTLADGTRLESGQRITCSIADANRDAHRFPDPGRLDGHRLHRSALSFGTGPHRCPGASFSLGLMQAALKEALAGPELNLAGPVESHTGSIGLRYLAVPARFSPGAGAAPRMTR